MTLIVTALIAVAALALLNLMLTLGVIRRLREQGEALAERGPTSSGEPPAELILSPGHTPDDFAARTVAGEEVTRASLATPALVGFFSPDCAPCKEWLPRFARAAGAMPGGPAQTLAVIVVSGNAPADPHVTALQDVARVVVEPVDGPVSRAFAVRGYPALCRLGSDGSVLTTDSYAVVADAVPA